MPHAIDDVGGEKSISEMWRKIFSSRFNCVNDPSSLLRCVSVSDNTEAITPVELCLLGEKLSVSKNSGADGIPANVFKYGSATLYEVLAYLVNFMIA